MESLLRAVLTSSDHIGTFSNRAPSKRDIKLANPHLHAALTSTQLKPRPAMKLTKSAVVQPPTDNMAGDKRPCQPFNKTPSRHSKLLEALISGVNHPTDKDSQASPLDTDSKDSKTDRNSKKPESLQKSRLFMALTSPMVSLDNWSHTNCEEDDKKDDSEDFITQPEIKPVKSKENGRSSQEGHHKMAPSSPNDSRQSNSLPVAIKNELSTIESNNQSDVGHRILNGNINFSNLDSQMPISLQNSIGYKQGQNTANPAIVHIKCEPQSEIRDDRDFNLDNRQEEISSSKATKRGFVVEINECFNGESRENDCRNVLSECLAVKKEFQAVNNCEDNGFYKEYSFTCDQPVKDEPVYSSCSTPSSAANHLHVPNEESKLLTANDKQPKEFSNLTAMLQSNPKRKNVDLIYRDLTNKDEQMSPIPFKKKKILIEKSPPKFFTVDKHNGQFESQETELDNPTPNRETGIFQKKTNTDAQILRRVLTEGIGELRGSANSANSFSNSSKPFSLIQIKDKNYSSANSSPSSSTFLNSNGNQQEKSPIKSQILRAALTSVEPIVPLRKPNSGSQSPSLLKIPPTAIKTETGFSGLNSMPPLCSNPPDDTYASCASAVRVCGEKLPSVFGNSNGQDSIQTAAAKDRPPKTKCQLLLAALTASDNSKNPNQFSTNESAPKQTSSEILRAALNNAEKDSQGIRAKHSQLLRAALTAVDTNKAAKSWHQTNAKLTNSRLLRAVLTGKYIPDTVDYTDYSKAAHRKNPMSCNLSNDNSEFSVSNTKLGTVTRSYDIVEITPNLGGGGGSGCNAAAVATKKDKVQKVSLSVNCNTRSSGHSILRAVLTGAIDIPHCAHDSLKSNSAKHPELGRDSNENRQNSGVINSCYGNLQDAKLKNNNNSQHQSISSTTSSSSSSSSLSSSGGGCKEQCCMYCGKYHSRNDSLWEYTSLFAGDTPHSCYECNQSFNVTCLFLDHMETHTNISSKYRCEFCGRNFKHVLSYIMCRLSHIDAQKEEKISCNLCNCEFTCHNKLKQHTRMHAKDRFTCKFCGKEFNQRVNYYLHERDHIDKISYTCKMCGEKFSQVSDLKAHHQSHYKSELYKCCKCIKCFVTQKALKLHEETHIPVNNRKDEQQKTVFMQTDFYEQLQPRSSREKRKILCEGCGIICINRYSLVKHKANCEGTRYPNKNLQVDMVSHSLVTIKD